MLKVRVSNKWVRLYLACERGRITEATNMLLIVPSILNWIKMDKAELNDNNNIPSEILQVKSREDRLQEIQIQERRK